MLSCCNNSVYSRINSMIDDLELFPFQKTLLKNRFLEQVVLYDKKAKTAEFFYILFSVFITVGSIILPALLSIQQMDYSNDDKKDEKIQITIYWLTWTISLLITICNGLIQLLGLNKQYLSFIRTREKMLSEGWYYFQLTGDYINTTHKNSFCEFCEEIEKIKQNQVDKELLFMSPKKKKTGEHTPSINSSNNIPKKNITSAIPRPRNNEEEPLINDENKTNDENIKINIIGKSSI